MVLKGVPVIFVPGAFNMTTDPAHYEIIRSRALDNQVFTFDTAPTRGIDAMDVSWGHSIAVAPWGNVITHMDEKERYIITEVDLETVKKVRQQLPLLQYRRTDLYNLKEIN